MDFALTEEQEQFQSLARRFAQEKVRPVALKNEWEDDPRARFPWSLVEDASRGGFRTLTVPEQYGGAGANTTTAALVAEEFAAADAGFTIAFNHCWRDIKLVEGAGTKEQKDWFFESFVKDDRYLTSIGMTEPAHGSDTSIPYPETILDTKATADKEVWIINGRKRFTSNGNEAKLIFLMASTDQSAPLMLGSSLFMLPTETEGLHVEEIYDKIGLRMLNNVELLLEGCRLGKEKLLGPLNRGFETMSKNFRLQDPMRSAIAVGVARSAYENALSHARQRIQGGRPIIEHQSVGMKLARMAITLETARTMVWRSAWAVDNPKYFDKKLGYMANYYAVRGAFEVCQMGMEIMGLNGLLRDTPAQKYLRDASIMFSAGTPIDNVLIRIQNCLREEAAGS